MLSERNLRGALYCAEQELLARKNGKADGPRRWNFELLRALELELAVSASGQDAGGGVQRLGHDEWIGCGEAARILRWHERKVRRYAADLDGRKVAGQWVFHATAVREYAEVLNDARDTA